MGGELETACREVEHAVLHRCELPGCDVIVEQVDGRPVRKYCGPAHRIAARRARAASSRGPSRPVRPSDVPAPPVHAAAGAAMPGDDAPDISHDRLLAAAGRRVHGWRRVLDVRSWPWVRPVAEAEADRHARVRQRARVALGRPGRVAVVSLKGGVGRTTVTAMLGLTFAELRGDRVAVLDADPTAGTLADRLAVSSDRSPKDVAGSARIATIDDADRYVGRSGRLGVLAGEQDPRRVGGLTRAEFAAAADLLVRFHDLVLVDTGAGLMNEPARAALAGADAVVVVGEPDPESAARVVRTLDWLDAHGHGELAANAVVVLCCTRGVGPRAIPSRLTARCRAAHLVPFDPVLASGGRIALERMRDGTRGSFVEMAASVGDCLGAVADRPDEERGSG